MTIDTSRLQEICLVSWVPMKGQAKAVQVWVLLGTFVFFAVGLPLGHICSDRVLDGWQQKAEFAIPATADAQAHAQEKEWQAALLNSQQRDFCQACLLAQNLLLNRAVTGLTVLRAASSIPERRQDSVIAATDLFQSASKRAPPSIR